MGRAGNLARCTHLQCFDLEPFLHSQLSRVALLSRRAGGGGEARLHAATRRRPPYAWRRVARERH